MATRDEITSLVRQYESVIENLERELAEKKHKTNELEKEFQKQEASINRLSETLIEKELIIAEHEKQLEKLKEQHADDPVAEKSDVRISVLESELAHAKAMLKETEKALQDARKLIKEKQNETLQLEELLATKGSEFSQSNPKTVNKDTYDLEKQGPFTDPNIEFLLLELQREADEVLNLAISVPYTNVKPSHAQIENLKATINEKRKTLLETIDDLRKNVNNSNSVSRESLSTLKIEDFSGNNNSEVNTPSLESMQSIPTPTGTESENNPTRDKQLLDKFKEEARLCDLMEVARDPELVNAAEHGRTLRDKYLKMLEEERGEKCRLMELLNKAKRLDDIPPGPCESSFRETRALVTELETVLRKEKEKSSLLATILETTHAKLTIHKADLLATEIREKNLEQRNRELGQVFVDALETQKKMISTEMRNFQRSHSINQNIAEISIKDFVEKYESLKTWEAALQKREEIVKGKEGIDCINDGEKQGFNRSPLVVDLNKKIRSLEEDKLNLLKNVCTLKEQQIVGNKNQPKDHEHGDESGTSNNGKEIDGVEADNSNFQEASDGEKLVSAGWTIAKVQRLYLKYFRAESFRKILGYQKRYLILMLDEMGGDPIVGNTAGRRRRFTFKVAVIAVISIYRMKYLVKKYCRALYKSSPQYPYKVKKRKKSEKKHLKNTSPTNRIKDTTNNSLELTLPSDEFSTTIEDFTSSRIDDNQNGTSLGTPRTNIPRSYPRPSALIRRDRSHQSSANGNTTRVSSAPNQLDGSVNSDPFVSNPPPLLSSTIVESQEDEKANTSRSTVGSVLTLFESLQNRLGRRENSRPTTNRSKVKVRSLL